jgi:2-oxoglutarate dehydrogenase E2 component (dihydrolipoamide succinyltransferase)
VDVTMPQLGETVTEATVTRWLKHVGDHVEADEPLFEVSTDKVDSEVPAPGAGVVTEILVAEGDTVAVGTRLAVLGDAASEPIPAAVAEPQPTPAPESEAASTPEPEAAPTPEPVPVPEPAPVPLIEPAPEPAPAPTGPVETTAPAAAGLTLTSPIVRRLVAEKGLDPDTIVGTGPGGRLTRKDVLEAAARTGVRPAPEPMPEPVTAAPAFTFTPAEPALPAPAVEAALGAPPAQAAIDAVPAASAAPLATPAGPRDEVVPFDNVRRRTAEHMVRSLATSAHVYTSVEVDFERVERARKRHQQAWKAAEGFSLTYLPFVLRAFCDVVNDFPRVNASVGDDALVIHHDVNIGVAVDLDFEGLLAPVIRAADDQRLRSLARSVHDLAARARTKRLSPDELSGGTFTVTNPGPYGTFATLPIINQPQVAILSTDGIRKRPVVVTDPDGDDAIVVHHTGLLVLTWDHRAFDGAYAAASLHAIRTVLEQREWEAELD